jgi:hypothetical protein
MAEISNPRFSRPIDVHRWSDHPEVKALVGEVGRVDEDALKKHIHDLQWAQPMNAKSPRVRAT